MDNPVFESSDQFASTTKNPLNFDGCSTFRPCDKPMLRRNGRFIHARRFRTQYIYGRSMDRKTCIWSGDGDSWLDKTSGIMWVGVHGLDSICVVSRTGDLDIKLVPDDMKNDTIESFLHNFRKTIIAEIEDLEDPSRNVNRQFQDMPNKLWKRVGQSIKKPFGIVSVGTDEVYKESGDEVSYDQYLKNKQASRDEGDRILECVKKLQPDLFSAAPAQRDEKNTIKFLREKMETDTTFMINETVEALEYDEKKAVKFLREKMESGVAFTMDKTIQAAISAFQHLFGKKFKANEIGVTVMDPDYINVSKHEAKYNDVDAKELEILDIEKHLAIINE